MSSSVDKATDAGVRNLPQLPGLEVVGRAIYLRPYLPYTLGQLLFERGESRVISSKETRENYQLPVHYEVNDSPPFPMNESLNQVIIEESWDRFEKQMSMDANAAIGSGTFSVNANSSWNSRLRAEQEAYYAVRSSFVPLWMVYVPNPNDCIAEVRDPDIPAPFSHEHRQKYDEFFRRWGSHYVRGAWVGGKSMLVFTVLKSSQLSKAAIHAGIKASFGATSGGASNKDEENKERLRNSSQCTVIGKGGDEVLLAAMSSLDQAAYNNWLKTIPQNPQVIELDVAGIWTLVRDSAKATALLEAYREAVTFEPIKAVFDIGSDLFFVRGSKFVRYERELKRTHRPLPIRELFPALEEEGFDRIDEAFRGRNLVSPEGERLDRKLFVARRDRILRIDIDTRAKDPGYPMPISQAFPGLPFERIDAALVVGFDSIYIFYGNQYVRFNPVTNRVEDGYPQPISKRWVGITFDRLDSAVYWGNGKVYFFKGDQHIRYDLANYRSDPGFPRHVVGNYVEDWKFVDE
ncbi:hemopexin repeat-containing protein [Nannocystis punicea]|uniref:Hemopexin repeat-containing protein n=1 Tax=Nannocystis punicea TaxID=2995304 RepID=A0ABY7HC15_9BACT|nr:hemopexin repeat-containing protein [Nannocystis poenicansa]WAS96625.1 hemopexin repeat-containing protein [Nannocystis poenicansa]